MQEKCLALINTITSNIEDFIVIYKGDTICFTNSTFNSFFGVASSKDFVLNFTTLVDIFVPHPSYFHAEKIAQGQTWFEAIQALDPIDRVVSFLSQKHEPHAFSVTIKEEMEDYKVVILNDITQSLIKRILIENKMNIDKTSNAYTKQYFMHIKQSIEDAARFNEKFIGLTMIQAQDPHLCNPAEFVEVLKKYTRENDMIIAWETNTFLLAYLIENATNASAVENKLRHVLKKEINYTLSSILQKEDESIAKMLKRLS